MSSGTISSGRRKQSSECREDQAHENDANAKPSHNEVELGIAFELQHLKHRKHTLVGVRSSLSLDRGSYALLHRSEQRS